MTKMTPQETVNAVKRFARQLEAVLSLAELVDNANKIDQLREEARGRLNDYEAKIKEAAEKLDAVNKRVESVAARENVVARDINQTAQKQAAQIVASAQFDAQNIVAQAEKMASETRLKAETDAAPLVKQAKEASAAWADLSIKLEAGKKELSDLQAKIDNARETIATLMRV